jgi:hypothetical protein
VDNQRVAAVQMKQLMLASTLDALDAPALRQT